MPGFASALSRRGCHVTVLTPDKAGPKDKCDDYQVRWFRWTGGSKPLVDFSLRSPNDLWLIASLLRSGERALRALITEERIEATLALWALPAGYLAWRACPPRTYSVWALGSDIHTWARRPLVGSLVRRVLRDAHHRFADGIELGKEVERISGRDCVFMPTTRKLPTAAPLPHPLNKGINFLFVGRLEAVKGADVIVDAMLRVLESGADASLVMCGAGSMQATLEARVNAAGKGDRIAFLSSQHAAVIAAYMASCDCLVIPSRNESIPIVFSEALQAGLPMLVTDVGDMGELARRHGLAAPIPPADAGALAAAMQRFIADRDTQVSAYRKARTELLQIFDVDATADRYLAAIESK
ncbi:MAG: glycosyltransferase family 4 protein [Chloroflexi bacterium]|nr:MAG: glycosyltransferase family 4 protein [Chloroflexota bacterium]